jgi:hypothetical protein
MSDVMEDSVSRHRENLLEGIQWGRGNKFQQ